ncbi:MAG TPA: DivIVA domain-containing protein [Acidimicrobiales bacterium]|nr:DivIVA domain-containing protein [Acidimicrobiales bacterium]
MDSPQQPAASILETLRTVEFRLGLKGYNVDEVDEYLEKAAVEAESVTEQLRQTTERLRQATERVAQLETERQDVPATSGDVVGDETLQRTLLLAQKFVDQTKRDSEAEAAELVSHAEERARATLAQAEERARQLSTEAEQRLRDEVTRLEAMRGQLAADVENMARHLESERNRLRTTLSEVLKWVDENIQPANSLMALRPRGSESGRQPSQAPSRPAEPARTGTRPPQGDIVATAEARADAETVAEVLDLRGGPGGAPPIGRN